MGSPAAAEGGGGEGAEESAVCTHGLDDHEVFLEAFELVDLDGFEEVRLGVLHDGLVGGAEAAGEVADGHAGAVDAAVVTAEEEVHGRGVCNEGLVDGTGAGVGDAACEERLRGSPAVGVRRISRGLIEEWPLSPLVCKDPDALGCEVEERRSDGAAAHSVLAGTAHLAEVAEEAEVHGTIGVFVLGGIHEMLALVRSNGEVLEGGPAALGLCENAAGGPAVAGREITLCGGGADEQGSEGQR